MTALQGVGVLVTRPEQQAMPLCRLLENQGASTLRLPAIEIKALGNRRETAARFSALEKFDVIIFTSTNAVRFGASLLDQKRDLTLAALGPATARALNQAGYRVAIQPAGTFDSESLLLHPKLEHLAGHRILIVKGRDGRPFLELELAQRGAEVATAEVYERVPAIPSGTVLAAVLASFTAGAVQVITATSLEIANNLLQIATPALRREFERAQWLVPGGRVAAGLRERGLAAPLLQADSAEDQDLVSALLRWRRGTSGA
ncbi:MAG TPA: uroporphyrinogen-III synthase [Steroidobacteraceae bacterium]|nr:uroporphyrinogen-III synthase [Steroidobacteraceae bacterium]